MPGTPRPRRAEARQQKGLGDSTRRDGACLDTLWNEMKTRTLPLLSPSLDSLPPGALDKFMEESGLSPVTVWRYRKRGWLHCHNIAGHWYITRAAIAEFNRRAAAGEFAKTPQRPRNRRR